MLDPKFQIPRVMVGGLALGGVVAGCGSDAPSEGEVINRLCAAMEECDPEDFAYDYDSQADCRGAVTEELDYYGENYGARCRSALVAYYACALPAYEATCDDPADCDAEYDAVEAACE